MPELKYSFDIGKKEPIDDIFINQENCELFITCGGTKSLYYFKGADLVIF